MKNNNDKAACVSVIIGEIARVKQQKDGFRRIVRNRLAYGEEVDITDNEADILTSYGIENINALMDDDLRRKILVFQRDFSGRSDQKIKFLQDVVNTYFVALLDGYSNDSATKEFLRNSDVNESIRVLLTETNIKPSLADNYDDGLFEEYPSEYYEVWRGCQGYEKRNRLFIFD